MIERIIDFSARNRFLIVLAYALLVGAGIWAEGWEGSFFEEE